MKNVSNANKGQKNLKWFFQAKVSSKKRTNKFIFTNSPLVFVPFRKEVKRHQNDISKLTFNESWKNKQNWPPPKKKIGNALVIFSLITYKIQLRVTYLLFYHILRSLFWPKISRLTTVWARVRHHWLRQQSPRRWTFAAAVAAAAAMAAATTHSALTTTWGKGAASLLWLLRGRGYVRTALFGVA